MPRRYPTIAIPYRDDVLRMVLPFAIYIAEGLIIFTTNMFYFAAIVRLSRLREKYGLIGMEFFADGITGLAVFLAGAIRLIKSLFDSWVGLTTQRICMIQPYNVILAWSETMTAVSMLMVSIDRLLSIIRPLMYYRNMANIQKYFALCSNLSMFPLILGSFVCSFKSNAPVDDLCWTPASRCPAFNKIYYGVRIAAAAASVAVYIVSLVIVRRYIRRMHNQVSMPAAVDKRQLQLTTTAGISCFATVGLYVLPMIVVFLGLDHEDLSSTIYTIIIIISNLNSIPKIIIVGWRSQDIFEAVLDLMPFKFRW